MLPLEIYDDKDQLASAKILENWGYCTKGGEIRHDDSSLLEVMGFIPKEISRFEKMTD